MTYSRNIARLKESGRRNLQQGNAERTRTAQQRGATLESEARDVAIKLSGFSKSLQEWKQEDIKVKEYEGKMQLRKEQEERALTIGSHSEKIAAIESKREQGLLLDEFKSAEAQDYAYNQLKGKILELQGVDAYPDADRIAKLSPHQQVGYVKEKLRQAKLKYADQLEYAMSNSEEPITIAGVTYTPKQLREKNIQALPFKEAAVNVMAAKLRKSLGIDKYSDAMLKVSGMDDTIQKAKDDLMGKYRERYNIESSMNTQSQAKLDYLTGKKGPKEAARFLLKYGLTVDKNNQLVGNTGALDALFGMWAEEGIQNRGDTSIVDEYANMPLPEALRKKLGKPPGTTFGDQWGPRFTQLRSKIRNGYSAWVTQELKNQKADGNAITASFIATAKKAADEGRLLTTAEVESFYDRYAKVGATVPNDVKNYETASKRDQRKDKVEIEKIIAAQDGAIYPHQLQWFHPLAASEYQEKAAKFEKAKLAAFDTEKLIKAELDQTFADMGVKANEKSPEYIEAFKNAKIDYLEQYNKYIAMGYDAQDANYYALHGKPGDVKGEDEKPLMINGVITEIKTNGAGSKYVVTGGNRTDEERAASHQRVAYIRTGKREIAETNGKIIFEGTIGGSYGEKQLKIIADSIEKHGGNVTKGLAAVPNAVQFYKGLSLGRNPRESGYYGLIDAQLKAAGYPGLDKIPMYQLSSGKNENDEPLEETPNVQPLANAGMNALYNGNPLVAMNIFRDIKAYENGNQRKSVWDSPEMVQPFLTGVA